MTHHLNNLSQKTEINIPLIINTCLQKLWTTNNPSWGVHRVYPWYATRYTVTANVWSRFAYVCLAYPFLHAPPRVSPCCSSTCIRPVKSNPLPLLIPSISGPLLYTQPTNKWRTRVYHNDRPLPRNRVLCQEPVPSIIKFLRIQLIKSWYSLQKKKKKKYQRNHASKNPLVYIKDEKQVKSILFHLTIVFRNLIIFELMIQKEKRINLKDILTWNLYIKNKKHEVCSVHLILVKIFP